MNEVNNNDIPNNNVPGNSGAMSFNIPPTNPSMVEASVNNQPVNNTIPSNMNATPPTENNSNGGLQSTLANIASQMPANNSSLPNNMTPENQTPAPNNANVSLGTVVNNGVVMQENINQIPQPTNAVPNGNLEANTTVNPLPQTAPIPENDAPAIPESEKEKKKTSPIVIIALILVILVGLAAAYYFLLETPKKVIGTAYDSVLSQIKTTQSSNKGYVNYDLKLNITSDNEQYKTYADIVNNIAINGTSGYNETSKSFESNNMITYKENQLLNLSLLVNENIAYVKLNNLLDKVLKISTDNNTESVVPSIDTDINDYIDLENEVLLTLKRSLDSAKYKKELVELNGSRVTKSTLFINKEFISSYYKNLLENNNYIEKYAKINNQTTDEVKADLNKKASEATENDETLSIYTSLIKNEFLKLDFISGNEIITLTKSDTKYNYEYTKDGEALHNGYVSINKMGTDTNLTINTNMLKENMNMAIACTYSNVDDFESLDIKEAVDINNLSEDDMTKLQNALSNNNAFKELIKDLGMTEDGSLPLDSMI